MSIFEEIDSSVIFFGLVGFGFMAHQPLWVIKGQIHFHSYE